MKSDVIEALKVLENQAGVLRPDDVVEAARNPESPLHDQFEWDDTEAANKYRTDQARTLIRAVRVHMVVNQIPVSTIGYVRDPTSDADAQGYVSVTRLRNDPNGAKAALDAEIDRASSHIRRARDLAAAFGLAQECDALLGYLIGLKEKVDATP